MTSTTASRQRTPIQQHPRLGASVRATAELLLTCECGQALDIPQRAYCPRCGRSR